MKRSLLFILSAVCVRFFWEPYLVSTSEMAPTLLKGDFLWVQKQAYGLHTFSRYWRVQGSPQRGEVVLLKEPGPSRRLMFKRVIALPGDRLFYSKGVLVINEKIHKPVLPREVKKELDFLRPFDFPGEDGGINNYVHWQEEFSFGPYSVLTKKGEDISFGPYKIPQGHYFVMGDHRALSRDSRNWPLYAQFAQGAAVLKKKSKGPSVSVPQDTILSASADPHIPFRLRTLQSAVVGGSLVHVQVQAVEPGLAPVEKNTLWSVDGVLSSQVEVFSVHLFSEGQDKSLVPFHLIRGRAVRILWSCEKTLPLLKFLCQLDSFRKGRWYWPVHKKAQGELNASK